jgi:hypothetical protein
MKSFELIVFVLCFPFFSFSMDLLVEEHADLSQQSIREVVDSEDFQHFDRLLGHKHRLNRLSEDDGQSYKRCCDDVEKVSEPIAFPLERGSNPFAEDEDCEVVQAFSFSNNLSPILSGPQEEDDQVGARPVAPPPSPENETFVSMQQELLERLRAMTFSSTAFQSPEFSDTPNSRDEFQDVRCDQQEEEQRDVVQKQNSPVRSFSGLDTILCAPLRTNP